MNKFDFVLSVVAVVALLVFGFYYVPFTKIFAILFGLVMLALFFYSKIKPFASKGKLSPEFAEKFSYIEKVFDPVLNIMTFAPKITIGPGLNLDTAQLILGAILIVVTIIF